MSATATFRNRMHAGEKLIGSFLKTPTSHGAEILADLGYDFVVIDQEHAPFDRVSTDVALLAARVADTAALVRVSGPEAVLSVLDSGATGVLMPHVKSAKYAREVAAMLRYRGGTRGYATSTRAGRYTGIPMWRHISQSDAHVAFLAQIEDVDALDEIDEIAAVTGVDSLFIGRGDLTAAFGDESKDPPDLLKAIERIAEAARRVNKPISVYSSNAKEAAALSAMGATVFVMASDQSFLRQAAAENLTSFRNGSHNTATG